MKIVTANSSIPDMTKEDAERFVQGKLNLQFATIDEKGDIVKARLGGSSKSL